MVLLFIVFPNFCFADSIESSYNMIASAWAKQVGLEVELMNSGNYLYSKINKEYRTPLTVSAYIADLMVNGKIQLNYKLDF